MALGLLRGDTRTTHRSRVAAPLWAFCGPEMLRERVTQGEAHRKIWKEVGTDRQHRSVADLAERQKECADRFLERGLRPCPRCFKERVSNA